MDIMKDSLTEFQLELMIMRVGRKQVLMGPRKEALMDVLKALLTGFQSEPMIMRVGPK
jgi:hypothetical protein